MTVHYISCNRIRDPFGELIEDRLGTYTFFPFFFWEERNWRKSSRTVLATEPPPMPLLIMDCVFSRFGLLIENSHATFLSMIVRAAKTNGFFDDVSYIFPDVLLIIWYVR